MKKIAILFLFFIGIFTNAQQTIYVNDDMFVMLNFPSKVEFSRVSASTEELLGIKEENDNLFIQSLVDDLPKSNITVKTVDGRYYSLILEYKKDIPTEDLNKFITIKEAINNTSVTDQPTDIKKQVKKVDLIPVKEEKKPTKSELKNDSIYTIIDKVYYDNGFIKSRNGFEKQKIRLELKGVYINNDKLYFLIGLRNRSNITYNIQSYLFSIVNKQSKKNVSKQVINIDPIETKNKIDILGVNQDENLVFVFDKFTIDDKKMFKIEIFEDKGERSLEFNITSDIITSAKSIQ